VLFSRSYSLLSDVIKQGELGGTNDHKVLKKLNDWIAINSHGIALRAKFGNMKKARVIVTAEIKSITTASSVNTEILLAEGAANDTLERARRKVRK
jgi:hypothetical protein